MLRTALTRYLSIALAVWMLVFALTRSLLVLAQWDQLRALPAADLLGSAGIGALYDVGFLIYVALALSLPLALCPRRWWGARVLPWCLKGVLAAGVFSMLFVAAMEWLFWNAYGTRFNFIAVDYLVYSEEMVDKLLESYSIYPLLAAVMLVSAVVSVALSPLVERALRLPAAAAGARVGLVGVLALLALLDSALLDQRLLDAVGRTSALRELAGNGPFQFFAAFRNNELDYEHFYATLPEPQAGQQLRQALSEPNARFLGRDPLDVRRQVDNPGEPRRLNVVLVVVESLSAKYMERFGGRAGLTPNLEHLRRESLFFTNFYATGTRTDRGLEAVTLSVPPTPGRSIVKRIGRESGYASLGQHLRAEGYDSVFLYGGHGYFDNLSAFFAGNGYRVVDQSSVPAEEVGFSTARGMADEDLYRQVLKVADADHTAGQPFFLQVMTTSNHRPYTYPAGRVDIPSGTGRHGAVKYTDYAIGEFLRQARSRPWFDRTVFVFLADHCAGSAGHEEVPVANYRIPMFVYAPALVTPGEFDGIASQIDVAPTLLGLLNIDYVSTFFGRNLLLPGGRPGLAPIASYQHLGLFDGRDLSVLSPRGGLRRHRDALGLSIGYPAALQDPLVAMGVAYYQAASHDFHQGLLAWRAIGAGLGLPDADEHKMAGVQQEPSTDEKL